MKCCSGNIFSQHQLGFRKRPEGEPLRCTPQIRSAPNLGLGHGAEGDRGLGDVRLFERFPE